MQIVIKATPEEITALVLGTQGQWDITVSNESDIRALAQAICDRQQGSQAQPDS